MNQQAMSSVLLARIWPVVRAHLPVAAEFDAVGRVQVDHLHPTFHPFFLGQRGHHLQRIAQDHAIAPLLLVLVELDAVEIGEEIHLLRLILLAVSAHVLDDGVGVDFFLDVDGHDRYR